MTARTPVTTAAELATLDAAEIVAGYTAARKGSPEPGDDRSKAFWHGWSSGRAEKTNETYAAQIELLRDCRRGHGPDVTKRGAA